MLIKYAKGVCIGLVISMLCSSLVTVAAEPSITVDYVSMNEDVSVKGFEENYNFPVKD